MEKLAPSSAVTRNSVARNQSVLLWLICAAACALFAIGAIRFYFGPASLSLLNSDAAVPVLLANEVLHTGSPLPATWYFGNDEIWTLSPHVFAIPFVAALGVSTLALKLGNILCLAVMLFFVTLPLHRVTRSWPYSIAVAACVLAAFSGFQIQVVYSQTAYGWFCAEFAILLYLALRMQDDEEPESWRFLGRIRWTTALYVLFLVNLAVESPLRAAVYWLAPVIAISILSPVSRHRARAVVVTTVLAFLTGAALHFVVSRYLLTQSGTTTSLFSPISEWARNLAIVSQSLPVLIGYTKNWYASVFDVFGAARFSFFSFAAIVVMIAPAGDGLGSAECRFFARVSGAMLLATLGVLIVGRLAVDPSAGRYLVPPALLCVAAFMAILWRRFHAYPYCISAIAAVLVVVFCGGAVALVSSYGHVASARGCGVPANICRLRTLLAATGVSHGYTTYWNGNVTTLVSQGEIRTCGVLLRPRLVPFRWLVSKDCFDKPPGDRYFLALTRTEIVQAGREYLIQEAGTPDEIVTDPEYEIWIYATAKANLDWLRR